MTPMSWDTMTMDIPSSGAEVLEQVEHLVLDADVERGRRLVREQQPGMRGDGHRDHHPLGHAAAELVGIGAQACACRVDADPLEQLRGAVRGGARRPSRSLTRMTSDSWSPTVSTGLRLAIGSWKIMPMSRPRIARSVEAGAPTSSWPSKHDRAPPRCGPGWARGPGARAASRSCPSRTRPRCPASGPCATEKVAPSTGRMVPRWVGNVTVRSRHLQASAGSSAGASHAGTRRLRRPRSSWLIERHARATPLAAEMLGHPLADEHEADAHDHDHETWQGGDPPRLEQEGLAARR